MGVGVLLCTPAPAAGAQLVQQAKLGPGEESTFGASVALSSSGSTAIVGSTRGSSAYGGSTAWIFTRTGSSWTQQDAFGVLVRSGSAYGTNVALSGSGNTALVGIPAEEMGEAYVVVRSGTSWSQQERFTPPEETGAYGFTFGEAVALSAGGTVALVESVEGVDVYIHSKTGWKYGGRFGHPQEGGSIAISGNGLTALIGGAGATEVEVFVHTRLGWSLQSKLPAGAESGLAMSANWNTALVGTRVYSREGTTWTEQAELAAPAPTSDALSSRGELALVGFPDTQTVREYAREGTKWTELPAPRTTETPPAESRFGFAAALSGTGRTAIVGAPGAPIEPTGEGLAWVFQQSRP